MKLLYLAHLQNELETECSELEAFLKQTFPDSHFCVHTHLSPIQVSVWRGLESANSAQLSITETGKLEINTSHASSPKYTSSWLQNICNVVNGLTNGWD